MRSIKIKLMFLYIALVFVVVIICFTYVLISLKNQELEKIKTEIKNYAARIDEQIIFELKSPEKFQYGLENLFYPSGNINEIRFSILNSFGETIASNILPYEKYDSQSIIKLISDFKNASDFCFSKEKIDDKTITWFDYACQSKFYNNKYIIFIKSDVTYFFRHLFKTSITMIIALILALILAGSIGFLFASTLTGSIIKLTKLTKEISNGNLEQKIITNSDDEIGELAANFSFMAQKLNNIMQKLKLENNKFETILQNMTDGVIYFNYNDQVVHYNYTAQNLFDFKLDKINFEFFLQQINLDLDFKIDLKKKLENNNKNNLEIYNQKNFVFKDHMIKIDDKYLNINFILCKDRDFFDGILIVIQDITKHKKLDEMRKELVANVSHEIRTPLTTIKAYTETLLDGAIDQKDIALDFLSIINSETDRITNLTRDLLDLSKFDNNQIKLDFIFLNLCEAIKKSIEQNKILLEQKNQIINFEEPKKIFIIKADQDRINQVFCNIITNAIKYSPNNTQIKIWLEETKKYFRVYIKDNGYGIPQEDLHRIFERFYRVDKTRSREMGGTGLGLSITKKIIEAHDGKITAVSKLNHGTTIIIRFNKVINKIMESQA